MADERQFSLNDILFHITNTLNSVNSEERQLILQKLGVSIKQNVAISSHVVKDAFKAYSVEVELDICRRCGSDDVKDKMRPCPVCGQIAHLQCFLTADKCCKRCVKPE